MVKRACSSELASPCAETELQDKERVSPRQMHIWRIFKHSPAVRPVRELRTEAVTSALFNFIHQAHAQPGEETGR